MSDEKKSTTAKGKIYAGVGIDIGTMNIVAARKKGTKTVTARQRDCFIDLEKDAKKMLSMSNVPYVEDDEKLIILGDSALEVSNLFNREVRRPLSKGLIAAGEHDAMSILSVLIESVLGEPQEEAEVCFYSIPAAPLDNPGQDVVYHEAVFEKILSELGYDPISGNEALAIVYSECASTQFSGIGISYGSGMTNVAMSYKTLPVEELQFSLERGGDWIDAASAKAVGLTASKMCAIKENGVNLMNPLEGDDKHQREREAIAMYYKNLISYTIDNIAKKFKKDGKAVDLKEPIPIIISGGTSQPEGFLELFQAVFDRKKKRFPIEISEIRSAENPMTAVAEGLLIQALQESE